MAHSGLTLELRSYSTETHTHSHDYHQLVLPVTGELSMNVDNREDDVSSQHVAVLAAGKEHGFAASEQNAFIVADVPTVLAPRLESLPALIQLDTALAHYVAFLHQQMQGNPVSRSSERQMLLLLIQLLQERFGKSVELDRRIEAARTYIDSNFHQPIYLKQLSAVANLSPRQLSELFCCQLGLSPNQYLIEKRMQRAWQLLEAGELSVQQVADSVGYSSLASFSDRFRKHFNHPPSYFRKIGK